MLVLVLRDEGVSALRGEGQDGSTPGARAVSEGSMGVGESQGGGRW